ncbi:TetR/AcrR family transcriptional regulator [Actinocorallia longicatena]|uniref:TetR/AcrR family transcriptional regulator n=1 Tax=Actinocorallia longicatena TaxID=111803 RepID=UPI0031E00EB0
MSEGVASLGRPVGSRGEDTRERIIAATMQCVAEMGYARATIREIARAADMTSGSLYHYFPNKAEIVKAAYLEVGQATMPGLAAAVDRADGLVGKLVALIDQGAQIVQDYPHAVAFDRAVRAPGTDRAVLSKISDSIFASLREIVEAVIVQAHRDGELNPDVTPGGAANAVFAIMRGLYDDAALTGARDFRATVQALQLLFQGRLITGPGFPSGAGG